MAVDRCVCWEVSFAELRRVALAEGLGFEELVSRTGCCTGCTTCEPYVRKMLESGETEFAVLSACEVREIMRRACGADRGG